VIAVALRRADGLKEGPAYWRGRYGRALRSRSTAASWIQGPLSEAFWELIIPSLATSRSCATCATSIGRISSEAAAQVAERLGDRRQVARSRVLPMRFLAARRAAPPRWAGPLQRALDASPANLPALPGRTPVLVDRSRSMFC